MNRHQRRAASKSKPSQSRPGEATALHDIVVRDDLASSDGLEVLDLSQMPPAESSHAPAPSGRSLGQDAASSGGGARPPSSTHGASQTKPGLMLRLFSTLLFSRWALARVRNPAVEALLKSMAMEVGRTDVVDELIRRDTMRQTASSRR